MTVGQLIKKTREKRGYSRNFMASELGISYSTYANYENGKRTPNIQTLSEIAQILKVPFDFLGLQTEFDDPDDYIKSQKEFANLMKAGTSEDIEKYLGLPIGTIHNDFRYENIKEKIAHYIDMLNKVGQDEAVKRVEELTYIEKYTKKD